MLGFKVVFPIFVYFHFLSLIEENNFHDSAHEPLACKESRERERERARERERGKKGKERKGEKEEVLSKIKSRGRFERYKCLFYF